VPSQTVSPAEHRRLESPYSQPETDVDPQGFGPLESGSILDTSPMARDNFVAGRDVSDIR